jgi:type I restriction enzyme, S subunit
MSKVFPEKSISAVTKVITSPVDKKTMPDEIPVFLCNYTDVYYHSKITGNMPFMEATAKQSEIDRFSLCPNDVVITKDSESADDIGIPTYIQSIREKLLCGYHLIILRPKKNVDGRFLSLTLTHPRISYDFYRYANGITRFGLTTETFSKVKIPLPTVPEQKAIAALLTTWDEAIEKTERLVQAKQKQLRVLIQKYISKPQLDEKSEGWEPVKLGDIFQVQKNKGRKGMPVFSVTLYDGIVDRSEIDRKMETNLAPEEHLLMEAGDLAYNMMRMWQGASGLAKSEGLISPAYVVIRPKPSVDSEFAAYWFKSPRMIHLFWAYSYGITGDRLRLYPSDFSLIKCSIPPISTQKRIVQILDKVQREIDLLKQLADKYKTQKRGLMQKILTGEWRVKPEIVNQYMEV